MYYLFKCKISLSLLIVYCTGVTDIALAAPTYESNVSYQFALIGDAPYDEDNLLPFNNLIEDINGFNNISWVLHAGDIKSGSSACSDELYSSRIEYFELFKQPFIYTPGDNDWTDCHHVDAGEYSPLERLAKLRQKFFARPGYTLGKTKISVQTQASKADFVEFPENVRWQKSKVIFASVHVVGSENATRDFPGRSTADDQEVIRRSRAAIAWLKETFHIAKQHDSPGVFIMIHADPKFKESVKSPGRKGFNDFLQALEREVISFRKPVVLAHGDTHFFRVDKPLYHRASGKKIENFTRVETFGPSEIHWVLVTVEPHSEQVFKIQQQIIWDNVE